MITLALLCIICAIYLLWRQYYTRSDEPPMVPGSWPFIGHMFSITKFGLWDTVCKLAEYSYTTGGVVSWRLGPARLYVVTDPDDMFTIANNCLDKSEYYDFGKPWVGEGLITAKLSSWKNHRKLFSPAFNQGVLDRFMSTFNSQSKKVVDNLSIHDGKGFFNHFMYFRSGVLETMCLTDLGVDFGTSALYKKYIVTADALFNTFQERFEKFWWHSPYLFRFSALKKEQEGFVDMAHKLTNTALQKRKIEFNTETSAQLDLISGTSFKTFVELLLEHSSEKNVLKDTEIMAHLDTMIAAGQDTVTNVLRYTTILLGGHPDVQEKVYAEIREVLGDGDVTKQNACQLVYLEAVLKESMRFYTVVPAVGRKLVTNIKLKNCTLLAGRTCILLISGAHQHPVWGPDRKEFIPERWFDPSRLPQNPNAYAAFSIGRRNCIAKTYAMMAMKITLAHLVRRYRITAQNGAKPLNLKLEVILKPVNGHFIALEKRT